MPKEIRLARCHHWRVTDEPCPEPATHEVVGPAHHLLCEEHARAIAEDPIEEGWLEEEGPERHAGECEGAASSLFRWMYGDEINPVAHYILEQVLTYLELYELPRARAALREAGGTPRPTEPELERLRFFKEEAQRYGWKDEPNWVTEMEGWIAQA